MKTYVTYLININKIMALQCELQIIFTHWQGKEHIYKQLPVGVWIFFLINEEKSRSSLSVLQAYSMKSPLKSMRALSEYQNELTT